jgi:two-component system, OmpR family, KDP operon response regulator KdpE
MSELPSARVLVVDDEPAIVLTVQLNLDHQGYQADTAATGEEALRLFGVINPDLVILDLGLPDVDGLEVIRRLRLESAVPIIVLTVRDAEQDKVSALDLGADDYVTKPFGVEELLARVRVALRHASHPAAGRAPVFRAGDLEVDLEKRRVRMGGKEIHLTPIEYDVLKVLVSHPNRVVTDRALLRQVWGPQYGDEAHYLHVYAARLRKKLEVDPQRPRYLITEPGVGYRLLVDD